MAIYLPYIQVLIGKKSLKSRWIEVLKAIAILSFFIALASPVMVTKYNNIQKEGRDIMLIIDSSSSMKERGFDINDLKKDKFSAVIDVVSNFIDSRKNDRIGLINFASSAFIASPLTFDKKFLKDILKKQRVGIAGRRTAIYDALLQGLYILENSKTKSKIAILLTDGIDNMSQNSFDEIVDLTKQINVKLYTIGIGENKDIEAQKLEKLAEAGGGKFFLATNKETLSNIYKEIDQSATTKIKSQSYKEYKYYYYYPLMLAILLLMLYIYIKSVRGVAK
jgi:Ca-activated chloride channel family protein